MKKASKIIFLSGLTAVLCFSFMGYPSGQVSAQAAPQIVTLSATNIQNGSTTLNGELTYLGNYGGYNNTNVYFEWGIGGTYGNQTASIMQNYVGQFSQTISGLSSYTMYHFRAVAQNSYGTAYGQDMTFTVSGPNNYYGNGSLLITKRVINLSSGNLNWFASASASPYDVLSFAITLQANGQDQHNVTVRDILPSYLIYRDSLTVNSMTNYSGDITYGINIGTIYAGQTVAVVYQAQVASSVNFSFGTTAISNNAIVTSNETGAQNANATVMVNKSLVYGASTVSTGLTNNFLTDSFFLPLLIIVAGLWFYFSGAIYAFADKLKARIKK